MVAGGAAGSTCGVAVVAAARAVLGTTLPSRRRPPPLATPLADTDEKNSGKRMPSGHLCVAAAHMSAERPCCSDAIYDKHINV